MAERGIRDASLICIGNLTVDEARYGGANGVTALGGDAAYAVLAARLYMSGVTMLTSIGHDVPPELLTGLRNAGVEANDLPMRDRATVRNIIHYHEDGSRTWEMLSTMEDFDNLSVYPSDVPSGALSADGMMLSAMSLQSQLVLTPWLRKNSTSRLYLDLQEDYIEGNREDLKATIGDCDVFMPSEVEAAMLSGTSDMRAAARLFHSWGPGTVVIKRAERGCLVFDDDNLIELPTRRTDVKDSTGAGDAFCGAFAAVHLTTGDVIAAADAGARAARIAISAVGIDGLLVAARGVHRSGQVFSPTDSQCTT
jgi:sugar/nucleoside kinase (ribokinase family)